MCVLPFCVYPFSFEFSCVSCVYLLVCFCFDYLCFGLYLFVSYLVCLFICLFVCMSVCLFAKEHFLSVYLFVSLLIYLSVCLSVFLYVCC